MLRSLSLTKIYRRYYHGSMMVSNSSDQIFKISLETEMCKGSLVVVHCPKASDFNFTFQTSDLSKLSIIDKISTVEEEAIVKEAKFGFIKEHGKHERLNLFMGGRLALRQAIKTSYNMNHTDLTNTIPYSPEVLNMPILVNDFGAPLLSTDYRGSISHKHQYAIAIAIPTGSNSAIHTHNTGYIGVDIEKCTNKAYNKLKQRLFTEHEQMNINNNSLHNNITIEEEIMLRFSFKESIYKAINPYLKRYVEFKEVEVEPLPDGTGRIDFHLKTGEQFHYIAEWRRFNKDYWITAVYAWQI